MAYTNPTVADFVSFFQRDFPFGTDPNVAVLDSDITKAFLFTNAMINQGLFPDQGTYNVGYNLLSAHFLVMNLRAASQGINGQFAFLETSKGVGGVSTSFSIPERILQNPELSMLTKTNYGAMYLQLLLPGLTGQMYTVAGSGVTSSVFSASNMGWGQL